MNTMNPAIGCGPACYSPCGPGRAPPFVPSPGNGPFPTLPNPGPGAPYLPPGAVDPFGNSGINGSGGLPVIVQGPDGNPVVIPGGGLGTFPNGTGFNPNDPGLGLKPNGMNSGVPVIIGPRGTVYAPSGNGTLPPGSTVNNPFGIQPWGGGGGGYPVIGAEANEESVMDRAKTFFTAKNETLGIQNGYIAAGALGLGVVALLATSKGGSRGGGRRRR